MRTTPEAWAPWKACSLARRRRGTSSPWSASAPIASHARFVDAVKAAPSEKSGWKFNDLIRIPDAACPTQLATVRVWRKPAQVTPPKLDGQGQLRIYLDELRKSAAAKKLPVVAMFAAAMSVEGCA